MSAEEDIFEFLDSIEPIETLVDSKKSTRISLKSFLKVYVEISNKGGNSIDVANELGISPQGVRQRASKLICKGVKLPKIGNSCRKAFNS